MKWIKICRPGTLTAGASPVFIGLITTIKAGFQLSWLTALITFIAALAIQIASNLFNDYYDYKKGLDKPGRLGPSRALALGEVSEKAMKTAIFIDLAVAVLCGSYLVWIGGCPILFIGVLSLLFAWLYTATLFSLSYLGIADIFVLIFFGPVATVGTVYLQTRVFLVNAFWLGLACGFISMAVLTVNNIRDIDSDRAAGKHSLAVRFGKLFAEWEYLVLFVLLIPCFILGKAGILCFLIVLLGILLFFKLRNTQGKHYNKMLIYTGLNNVLFALLYLIR